MERLLKNKANPQSMDLSKDDEQWPLLSYLLWQEAPLQIVQLALECGADPNVPRTHPNGPYMPLDDSLWNNENADYARLLIAHGADIHSIQKIQYQDYYEEITLLNEAVYQNREALVALLLRYGANPSDVTEKTYSSGRVEKASLLHEAIVHAQSAPIFYLLVKSGASINTPTTNVTTGEDIPFCKYPYNLDDDWKYLIREAGWKGPGLFSRFF